MSGDVKKILIWGSGIILLLVGNMFIGYQIKNIYDHNRRIDRNTVNQVSIEGQIRTLEGTPIQGVQVRAPDLLFRGKEKTVLARTDENGKYHFTTKVGGSVRLKYRHPDYKNITHVVKIEFNPYEESLHYTQNITLRPLATISGQIRRKNGSAKESKRIHLLRKQSAIEPTGVKMTRKSLDYVRSERVATKIWRTKRTIKPEENGKFRFENVEQGAWYKLRVEFRNRPSKMVSPFRVSEQNVNKDIIVSPAKMLKGQVIRENGEPVKKMNVYVVNKKHPENQVMEKFENQHGTFRINAPGSGPYYVSVTTLKRHLHMVNRHVEQNQETLKFQIPPKKQKEE